MANTLALSDDKVYMNVGVRLVIVDVSNPHKPAIIGRSEVLPGGIKRISALGEYALVEDGQGDQWVFEISESGNPQSITDLTRVPQKTAKPSPAPSPVRNRYSFAYDPDWSNWLTGQPLTVMDLTSHTEVIKAIGSLPEGEMVTSGELVARGRFVYVAARSGLEIYDLSIDPHRTLIFPVEQIYTTYWNLVGRLTTDVGTLGSGCCMGYYIPDICVIEDYLSIDGALWSLDNPENPEPAGYYTEAKPTCDGYPVQGGMIIHKHVSRGIYSVLNTRDPANPTFREVPFSVDNADIVAVDSDRLFLYVKKPDNSVRSVRYELQIVDITDPYDPQLMGSYFPVPDLAGVKVNFVGDIVYIHSPQFGVETLALDISDPFHPNEALSPDSFFFNAKIIEQDGLLLALRNLELRIYSADHLLFPLTVFHVPPLTVVSDTNVYSDMWYSEDRLFVTTPGSLLILDLHQPEHPSILTVWDNSPYQVAAYGDYLYFHMLNDGIGIFKLVPN
ncbi:MAG: hypothetical protein JXB07_17140 [Anaerolineae bacterium]|nr:hypothetical protein [Anaerolineae bacterium]